MNKFRTYILALLVLLCSGAVAQSLPVADQSLSTKYPFTSSLLNRVFNASGLDSFFQKLYTLKQTKSGRVTIVHIGDSHIQPDIISGIVRNSLQDFFGNAGRGLVFPYQLAQSNAPADISSSSFSKWDYNRLAHPEIPIQFGISGFGLHNNTGRLSLDLSLRNSIDYTFDHILFFLDSVSENWILKLNGIDTGMLLTAEPGQAYRSAVLTNPQSGFSLSNADTGITRSVFGISLENSKPGVLLHTIGVNGARYDQYNDAALFWNQLPALQADLYIISLGTNEAQRASFVETAFLDQVKKMIAHLKTISPTASILITTAPDSYKGRTSNKILPQLNRSLVNFCNAEYLPYWDLYQISNGYGSAYSWSRRGLMSRDRIHFTAEGYRLQGGLLSSAIAKAYNNFVNNRASSR